MDNTVFNGSNLSGAILSGTNPGAFEAKDLRGCPTSLPSNGNVKTDKFNVPDL